MKISKETISVLKNYAAINSNLLIKEGSKLSTISTNKTVASSVSVAEQFPVEFGIYDLNAFLGALSLFNSPELEFNDKFVTIQEGNNKIKYFAAASTVLISPQKDIQFPESDITFTLPATLLDTILRTAGVLKASDVSLIGNGETITLQIGDKKNDTSNTYETVVGETQSTFRANIKIENFKMMNSDYEVSISNKRVSRFKTVTGDLVYYVAVESDSTF